jgi:hypothetical protein
MKISISKATALLISPCLILFALPAWSESMVFVSLLFGLHL